MKRTHLIRTVVWILIIIISPLSMAFAQGTAFTYQGQLRNNGGLAGGSYDLQFTLYDTNATGIAIAGPVTNSGVAVSNGLFTTTIDFGSGVFTGGSNWLEIAVQTNDGNNFVTLIPRQQLTPTPYALAANIAFGLPGLTIQMDSANGTENIVGGSSSNSISTGVYGATIAGGGGATESNTVNADFGTIGGGGNNVIDGTYGGVGGGYKNVASGYIATIAGGAYNSATTNEASVLGGAYDVASGQFSTVGGGYGNAAGGDGAFVGGGGFDGSVYNGNLASAEASVIGGGVGNIVVYSAYAAMIGGGNNNFIDGLAANSFIGGGSENFVSGVNGAIGGGLGNRVNANDETIGGGDYNMAGGSATTIAGGFGNTNNGDYGIVGGGERNSITSAGGVIGGGIDNLVKTGVEGTIGGGFANMAAGDDSAVGGGDLNQATGQESMVGGGGGNLATGLDSTVPGGNSNTAGGDHSFAAGNGAQANHLGSFVWADSSTFGYFTDAANNQFLIHASGGVGIGTSSTPPGGIRLDSGGLAVTGASSPNYGSAQGVFIEKAATAGAVYAYNYGTGQPTALLLNSPGGNVGIGNSSPGQLLVVGTGGAYCNGTTWVNGSDRNSKQDFTAINPRDVLAKVSAMPITEWQYRVEPDGVKHLGPMAQDFHSAFGLNGSDDKHISTVDEGGVALAAIQGLNEKLEDKSQKLEAENAQLKQQLAELKLLVQSFAAKK